MVGADERWGVIGNSKTIEHLQRLVSTRLPTHAFLLVGPRGIGKTTAAISFANALACLHPLNGVACGDCLSCATSSRGKHPDLHLLAPASGAVGIEDARVLLRALERRPVLSPRLIAVIDRADGMTEEATNAFLKTLEEPRGDTVLILTATTTSRLPATLVSRCSVYQFTVVSERTLRDRLLQQGVERRRALELATFSDGRPGFALYLERQRGAYEQALEEAFILLDALGSRVHERISVAERLAERLDDPATREGVLERWESTARRLLRVSAGGRDTGPLAERIRTVAERLNPASVVKVVRTLSQVRTYLRVGNPRLAAEVLTLHLPTFP